MHKNRVGKMHKKKLILTLISQDLMQPALPFSSWSHSESAHKPFIYQIYSEQLYKSSANLFTKTSIGTMVSYHYGLSCDFPRWFVDVHGVTVLFNVQRTRRQREETMLLTVL